MEPGGPKRDLLGLSATATWGHMLAPKGRQGYTPSSLAIPAFNLSPKPGPYGGGRPGDHLLRGLGADMAGVGGGSRKRQSLGFLPSRSFLLFSLDREIPFSPCLPGPCLPDPAVPTRGLWERPLVATVQMIVICAMRENQMCLVGAGVVGVRVGGSRAPCCLSWFSRQCLSCTHHLTTPSHLQTCLPQGSPLLFL